MTHSKAFRRWHQSCNVFAVGKTSNIEVVMKSRVVKAAAVIAVGFSAFVAQPTRATMTYNLDNSNFSSPYNTGPFGTVTVNLLDPTQATITFNSSVVGSDINLFGNVYANINATTFSVASAISASNTGSGFSAGPYSSQINNPPSNVDGRGAFNLEIADGSNDGFPSTSTTISFTVTDVSGTWSSASSVLYANANGNYLAAHTFITENPPLKSDGAIVTGYSASDTYTSNSHVPDGGSTAVLLGSALLGLGWVRVRFSK